MKNVSKSSVKKTSKPTKKIKEHFGCGPMGGHGDEHCGHGPCRSKSALIGLMIKVLAAHTEILVSVDEKLDKLMHMVYHMKMDKCGHGMPPMMGHGDPDHDHCDNCGADIKNLPPYEVLKKKFMAGQIDRAPEVGMPPAEDQIVVVAAVEDEDGLTEGVDPAIAKMSTDEKLRALGIDFNKITHNDSQVL